MAKQIKLTMHRAVYLFLLLSAYLTTKAQETVVDTARYRFSYAMKGTFNEESKSQYDEELSVDIGDSVTYCYSRWQKDNDILWKKVKAAGGSSADYMAQQGPWSVYNEDNLFNYPRKGKLSVVTFSYKYFMYTELTPEMKWQLAQGDTTILGYACKKATCDFRGRSWSVWYTMQIPMQQGPWKLHGLPGMILVARDKKNQFSFECIGIKTGLSEPMEVNLKRVIKTTPQKVQRILQLKASNYEAWAKFVGYKAIWGYKSKPRVACLKEYY